MVTDNTVGMATGIPPIITTKMLLSGGHIPSPSIRILDIQSANTKDKLNARGVEGLTPIHASTTLLSGSELNS